MPDRNQPLTETPYSDEELEHFRKKLVQEQININEEIEGLKESYEGIVSNEEDTKSSIDHHHGNIGTEEEIKERNLILIERYNKKIELINAALDRIENKTYGICEHTGQVIEKERLEAVPWTRYSKEAQEKFDDPNPGRV